MKRNVIKILLLVLIIFGVLYSVCYADEVPIEIENVNGTYVLKTPNYKPLANPKTNIDYKPIIIAGIVVTAIVAISAIVLAKEKNKTQLDNNKKEE